MPAKNAQPKDLELTNDGKLVWPLPSALVQIADRHHTVGMTDTFWSVHIVKSEHTDGIPSVPYSKLEYGLDGQPLIKRVQPKDKKTACRIEANGLTDVMARMLALLVETVKGFDSTTARIAACTFRKSYPSLKDSHYLDSLFGEKNKDVLLEIRFSTSKSTGNAVCGLDDQFCIFATFGQLIERVNWLADMVEYLDANTTFTPKIKKTSTKTENVEKIKVNLDLASL